MMIAVVLVIHLAPMNLKDNMLITKDAATITNSQINNMLWEAVLLNITIQMQMLLLMHTQILTTNRTDSNLCQINTIIKILTHHIISEKMILKVFNNIFTI